MVTNVAITLSHTFELIKHKFSKKPPIQAQKVEKVVAPIFEDEEIDATETTPLLGGPQAHKSQKKKTE